MPLLIPTQPDEPNYTITCNLDGTDYQLTFRYSGRSNTFYVDLALTDGTPLVSGRKVVCNWALWTIFKYNPQVPQGAMVAVPSAGAGDNPPGFDANGNGELGEGRRVQLWYYSAAEVAAAQAGTSS